MRFVYEERAVGGRGWIRRFEAPVLRVPCTHCNIPVRVGAPLCAFHLEELHGLRIGEEGRLGRGQLGLFATRSFRPGDFIVPYGGEVVTNAELERRYGNGTAPYALELSSNRCLDGALLRSAGACANHFMGLAPAPNARFEKRGGTMWLRAVERIERGDAILLDYGNDYKLREENYRYFTRR